MFNHLIIILCLTHGFWPPEVTIIIIIYIRMGSGCPSQRLECGCARQWYSHVGKLVLASDSLHTHSYLLFIVVMICTRECCSPIWLVLYNVTDIQSNWWLMVKQRGWGIKEHDVKVIWSCFCKNLAYHLSNNHYYY